MAIGAKLRYQVLRRDGYACRFCGITALDGAVLEIDHVVPRAHGGRDELSNLQALCDECNAGKSAMMPEKWLVKEVKQATRLGTRRPDREDNDSGMLAYLEARFSLEDLTAEQALMAITHVAADVYPYRPDASELVIAASIWAAETFAPAEVG